MVPTPLFGKIWSLTQTQAIRFWSSCVWPQSYPGSETNLFYFYLFKKPPVFHKRQRQIGEKINTYINRAGISAQEKNFNQLSDFFNGNFNSSPDLTTELLYDFGERYYPVQGFQFPISTIIRQDKIRGLKQVTPRLIRPTDMISCYHWYFKHALKKKKNLSLTANT